jgi:hypothetical protein
VRETLSNVTSPPNHRALSLLEGGTADTDIGKEYTLFLKKKKGNPDLLYAIDIYEDPYKSEVIEAFLLAQTTDKEIEQVLRVPANVCSYYRHLFFDMSSFKDELDIESYVQTYDASEFGKDIKVCAATLGIDYLRYRFGRGSNSEVSLLSALKNMIETGYVLSKATRLNPLNSDSAKEARQWMMAAIKGMDSYAKIKPTLNESHDDFLIALQSIDHTTNEMKNPDIPKDEIVH